MKQSEILSQTDVNATFFLEKEQRMLYLPLIFDGLSMNAIVDSFAFASILSKADFERL